jgi:glycosyltransferase involved in cell wall biosynthesis
MKPKVIHIIAEIGKSHHFEWITLQLKDQFEYKCILIGKADSHHARFLKAHGVEFFVLGYESKRSMFSLMASLIKILMREKPLIVHTHFWIASLIGIPLCWLLNVPIKILTRHHGDLHHKYFPKGVYLDTILNWLSDHIITPTEGIRELLVTREKTSREKITVIHHGVDLAYYANTSAELLEKLLATYSIPDAFPVVGMISRFVEWKGIQYAIDAFIKLLQDYPQAHLVLANANGEYGAVLREKLSTLRQSQYTEIPYESDTPALYALFDVFVHVPVDTLSESFGLTYVESLAAGRPSVFTISGIARELVKDGHNALVVDYRNAGQIKDAISKILKDGDLRQTLSLNARNSVAGFSFENMGRGMITLYNRLIEIEMRGNVGR